MGEGCCFGGIVLGRVNVACSARIFGWCLVLDRYGCLFVALRFLVLEWAEGDGCAVAIEWIEQCAALLFTTYRIALDGYGLDTSEQFTAQPQLGACASSEPRQLAKHDCAPTRTFAPAPLDKTFTLLHLLPSNQTTDQFLALTSASLGTTIPLPFPPCLYRAR